MKKIAILLMAAASLAISSCSEDYLQLAPEDSVSPATLFATPENAQYAINGLAKIMSTQYLSQQGYNGEGTVMAYGAEWPGDAFQKCNYTGWSNLCRQNYNESNSNTNVHFIWYYYYKIIGNANQALVAVPEDCTNEWAHIRAQALVYRAYAYTMLSQYYCRRWVDGNGSQRGLPIRLNTETGPIKAASLRQVYARIYKDLDEALALFARANWDRDKDLVWQANANVAHAVYARAALIRQDWNTVIEHAPKARAGFPLMTAEDYMAGFNTPNREWIWEVFEDETQQLHYYSFFNYMGSNCAGSSSRNNPGGINKAIITPINKDDARLAIYGIPTESELSEADAAKIKDAGNVTKGAFYTRIKKELGSRLYSTTKIFYYIATKFLVKSNVGDGCLPIFRSAEMIYAEAEAQFHLGNESAAQKLLEEAVAPYQSNYSCTKTGQALWDEIVNYRKFDLYGEGHNLNDLKRWNVPMNKKTWTEGGSFHPTLANESEANGGKYSVAAKNRWTKVYPTMETNYNNLVSTYEPENFVSEVPDEDC